MNWKGKRVLVSGAGGFIGSHVVRRLVAEGARVHVLVRKNSSLWRLRDCREKLTVCEDDLTDPSSLRTALLHAAPRVVFHLAALVDVTRSWELIDPLVRANILGTINLVSALKDAPLEAFVNTGSSEDYGDAPSPLREDRRESPISPYSFSKVAGTYFCQMAARTFDLPITTLRLFPTYGPFQESAMLIPSAIRALVAGKEFHMSHGGQKREFNYVDDVADAYLRIAACPAARGEVVNVGSGIPYAVRDVVTMIQGLVGGDGTVRAGSLPCRKGEGRECVSDSHRLRQLTGWAPQVPLEEGLRKTVEWYKHRGANDSCGNADGV